MADEAKEAAAEQLQTTEPVTEAATPVEKEETIGEVLQVEEPKKEPKLVPEAVLLEYKKDNKELRRELKDLKTLIENGGSKKEVSSDLKAIAEEHDVDPEFLQKFAAAVKAQAESELEDKFSSKLRPLEEKEKAKEIEAKISAAYKKAIEDQPEYKDLVTKKAFESLVRDPSNANKTLSSILEESYGHLVTGKRTLETAKPGGGKEDAEVDFDRAKTDSDYFKQIMSDPHMKKKYNDNIAARLNL
jgi:hypothetical protein